MMDIEKKLEMFSPGKLSDLLVIYDHLLAAGLSMKDLRAWLNERTSQMQKQAETEKEQIDKLIKKYAICPDCGAPMQIVPAYGAIKTRFACTQCDLALDSQDSPSKWIYKFMEKEEDKSNVQQIATEKQTDTAEPGNDQEAGTVGGSGKVGESNASSSSGKSLG